MKKPIGYSLCPKSILLIHRHFLSYIHTNKRSLLRSHPTSTQKCTNKNNNFQNEVSRAISLLTHSDPRARRGCLVSTSSSSRVRARRETATNHATHARATPKPPLITLCSHSVPPFHGLHQNRAKISSYSQIGGGGGQDQDGAQWW